MSKHVWRTKLSGMKCEELSKFIMFRFRRYHFVLTTKMMCFFFRQREPADDAKEQDRADDAARMRRCFSCDREWDAERQK